MRRLVRALVVVALAGLVELLLARTLAMRDPVAALLGRAPGSVVLFVPLYLLRLALYFGAPPWLAVRAWLAVRGWRAGR